MLCTKCFIDFYYSTEKVKSFNWITEVSTKIISNTAFLPLLLGRHYELALFPVLKFSDLIIFIVVAVVLVRTETVLMP